MTPRATMRLQFHKGFTFADAETLVPYLAALGISHLYASPITRARAGSMHGYDVVDPTTINPELGGEEGFRRLVAALRKAGLGVIIDIVPNHMAANLENRWWVDVLTHGRSSRYAYYFDIDWESGKAFLPWLDRPLPQAEADGKIAALNLPQPGAYELGWWRTASDRINWRRFFDINELVCLDMENEQAFEDVHALILRLHREGLIDGVRVDHIDGLADPAAYCRKLRDRLGSDAYFVVEKILLRGEALPSGWRCDGTTGYDFMDEVSALQHDPRGGPILAAGWAKLSGRPATFEPEEEVARREIIARSFGAPLEACVTAFARLGKTDPRASELSPPALRRAITELLVHFPVYRSYASATERPTSDRPFLAEAAQGAMQTGLASDRWVVDLLHRWMREPVAGNDAIRRFQQLSAPIAAKSVEDTAFYRYGPLLSRNDVGFDVERFGLSSEDFHDLMRRRHGRFPHALLATATHDHKRGEDVRARLAVLSEQAERWTARLSRWVATSGQPPGDTAMLLQMIVGAWPLDVTLENEAGRAAFAERLAGWQQKALREAKLRSDWFDPNEEYEQAARTFLHRLVVEAAWPDLLGEIFACVQEIAAAGAVNGLAQLLVKLTTPGVPDLYQGTDGWDFSLVDPDNRRPVDFAARQRSLADTNVVRALDHWRDGTIKQAIVARTLAVRRLLPALFAEGSYEPVKAEGAMAKHVVAFLRRHGEEAALTIVLRLPTSIMVRPDRPLLAAAAWQDTRLVLPETQPLFSAFDGTRLQAAEANVAMQHALGAMPVGFFSTRLP